MSRLHWSARLLLRLIAAVILLGVAVVALGWWYFNPAIHSTRGVVYGTRNGKELTLDVIRPENPGGIGILVMVSGSWKSRPQEVKPWMVAPFIRQGHTVIAVSHLSQPEATIMDIVADVQRATRFVRHHAAKYGVDPHRLGVVGGSSGGHLSLMLATCGGPGKADAPDAVDRQDSSVQAVAVFYPVTDLLNLGPSTQNLHDGGPPKSFRGSFGPKGTDLAVWKVIGHDVSPIYHITPALPPIRIIHGDADTLVPLEQSTRFKARAAELGREVELSIHRGGGHGWSTMVFDAWQFAGWLTDHLPPGPVARPIVR